MDKDYKRCLNCIHLYCGYFGCNEKCHAYIDEPPWCICVKANYDEDGNCPHYKKQEEQNNDVV